MYPYAFFENRIDELDKNPQLKGWKKNDSVWKVDGEDFVSLSKNDETYFFGVKKLRYENINIELFQSADVYVKLTKETLTVQLISDAEIQITTSGIKKCKSAIMVPGSTMTCRF